MKRIHFTIFFTMLILLSLVGCKQKHTPKPNGYLRIDFPEKKYQQLTLKAPYSFEYPVYTNIEVDNDYDAEPYWINIKDDKHKVKIHLSYKKVNNNLQTLTEESHELAYKHSIKANSINEQLFINPEKHVYGTIYKISGNVASPFQFHLTDSTKNFIRGSFYISEVPNYDSLVPIINFYDADILHLIETFSWE